MFRYIVLFANTVIVMFFGAALLVQVIGKVATLNSQPPHVSTPNRTFSKTIIVPPLGSENIYDQMRLAAPRIVFTNPDSDACVCKCAPTPTMQIPLFKPISK